MGEDTPTPTAPLHAGETVTMTVVEGEDQLTLTGVLEKKATPVADGTHILPPLPETHAIDLAPVGTTLHVTTTGAITAYDGKEDALPADDVATSLPVGTTATKTNRGVDLTVPDHGFNAGATFREALLNIIIEAPQLIALFRK